MINETEHTSMTKNDFLVLRTADLKENATFNDLALKVARLELSLMDLLDSTLDAVKYPDMAILSVPEHLPKLDKKALDLLLKLDEEGDYIALWGYLSDEKSRA
ncbi:hypothetical protein AB6M97_07885 [Streptococcus hillyeri]|uniref:Phage protein n=1 Tax=Streptococcus hillyeri TaxID=2282420 RepID=A0A3L9DTC6_9STRE|nr:hypothetical protein [Streptococcus hillyeri]RLY02909.1 hypothetical protein EAF07_06340 [Streptococcus hillyeri]